VEVKKDHIKRINLVKQFIHENLDKELPLEALANIANYSPFHFQKLFKELESESPKQYVKRIRLEGSAHTLALKSEINILNVALEYGFTSLESFSRAFKNHYKISPVNFRKLSHEEQIVVLNSELKTKPTIPINNFDYTADKFPAMKVYGFQHPFTSFDKIIEGFKKMEAFALTSGLHLTNRSIFGLILDHPKYTELSKCRFYICLNCHEYLDVPSNFIQLNVKSSIFIGIQVNAPISVCLTQIDSFASYWLKTSGYIINHNIGSLVFPVMHPDGSGFAHDELNIHIPVKTE